MAKIALPVRLEDAKDRINALEIVDAEDEVLTYLPPPANGEDLGQADGEIANFMVIAFNLRCPFEGDCEHYDGHTGCNAIECIRNVVVEV